jgi:ADP-dependent phosphofructokinase/glucokinase
MVLLLPIESKRFNFFFLGSVILYPQHNNDTIRLKNKRSVNISLVIKGMNQIRICFQFDFSQSQYFAIRVSIDSFEKIISSRNIT